MSKWQMLAPVAAAFLLYPMTAGSADERDDATKECQKVAGWHGEFVVKRDFPESDPYDAVAIGNAERTEAGLFLVSGEVTIFAMTKEFNYRYVCEYDPADNGGASRITALEPME